MKIAIVIGSTREGRVSDRMAKWIRGAGEKIDSEHEWKLIDLRDYNLPMFDEPLPPMAGRRPELGEGTKKYLEEMGSADAFIFVTPEYNHGMSAVLKNAIDLLDYQLMKKPVAFAGHGVVGGARAIVQLKTVVNSNLGAVPMPGGVTISDRVAEIISEEGELVEEDGHDDRGLGAMLDTLLWYGSILKTAREE